MGLNGSIFKKINENMKTKKNPGSRLEVWLSYLAGNFEMAPMIFFIFSGYFFEDLIIDPVHFCLLKFQL